MLQASRMAQNSLSHGVDRFDRASISTFNLNLHADSDCSQDNVLSKTDVKMDKYR